LKMGEMPKNREKRLKIFEDSTDKDKKTKLKKSNLIFELTFL